MKLSYRDKVIFLVTIALTLLVCGYFLLISPKMDEYESSKLKLAAKQSEKTEVMEKLDVLPLLSDNLKNSVGEIEKSQSRFLTASAPYEFENFLRETIDENDVELLSMTVNYTQASDIIEYMYTDPTLYTYDMQINADIYKELPQEIYDIYEKTPPEIARTMTLGVTEVEIGYGIDPTIYDITSILNFIDDVAAAERTMTVLNLETPSTEEIEAAKKAAEEAAANGENVNKELQEGRVSMRLYSIHPLNTERVLNGEQESDSAEEVVATEE